MKKVRGVIANIILICVCCAYLFPIYIIVVNAFKNRAELYENVLAFPSTFSFQYFAEAMDKMEFLNALKNSLIVTLISIAIIIVLASMCAWMLARTDNKISKIIFMTFVATMLIPFQTLMMPLMQVLSFGRDKLHLPVVDSLGGLIFCYIGFGASMSVFLFHGFVKSVHIALEEAETNDDRS